MIWKWLKKNIDIKGYDITAFLCHQAVEKLLKCIFVLDIREIPRSHHIDELAKDLNLEANIIDLIKDLTYDYTFS
ncbi:MAG: HEPN domain-containing protein [Candidatus Methanofastidiosum sp.]|nr:HEPN domain-containing protein [Methanofastidiosum sp.]